MSKIKAAASEGLPDELLAELDSQVFADALLMGVHGKCLHVEKPTRQPAGHYVQKTDITVQIEPNCFGVEVRFSGISVTPTRTDADFHEALAALASLYRQAIRRDTVTFWVRETLCFWLMSARLKHFN